MYRLRKNISYRGRRSGADDGKVGPDDIANERSCGVVPTLTNFVGVLRRGDYLDELGPGTPHALVIDVGPRQLLNEPGPRAARRES